VSLQLRRYINPLPVHAKPSLFIFSDQRRYQIVPRLLICASDVGVGCQRAHQCRRWTDSLADLNLQQLEIGGQKVSEED